MAVCLAGMAMHVAEMKKREFQEMPGLGSSWTIARFGVVCAALYALSILLPDRLYLPGNRLTAQQAGMLLGFFNLPLEVQGTTISLYGFRAAIITECSGVHLSLLLVSFVACAPAPRKAKFLGLFLGLPLLHLANVVRIALVTAVGAWQPQLFECVHLYLMQIMMVLLVCLCCKLWLRWAAAPGIPGAPLDFLIRFVVFGSLLFMLWLPVHRAYVGELDRLVIYLFSMVDFALFIPARPEIYHHTLSLVLFAALACASSCIGTGLRAFGLAAGLAALVLVHILLRVTYVFLIAWHLGAVEPVYLSLHLLNQYLLPVLLWLALLQEAKKQSGVTR
jgi:exosortase H (IPTLxxWG-CTERM-specific)